MSQAAPPSLDMRLSLKISLSASLATKRPPPALPFRVPRRPKMQRGACLG
jgi:hypothetical protein